MANLKGISGHNVYHTFCLRLRSRAIVLPILAGRSCFSGNFSLAKREILLFELFRFSYIAVLRACTALFLFLYLPMPTLSFLYNFCTRFISGLYTASI